MEHLIVALHSHAFLCLGLLLYALLMLGQQAVAGTSVAFLDPAFGLVEALLWIWAPLYLLLMQKRVYGQGWTLTSLKFVVIGGIYSFTLMLTVMALIVVSLARA